MFGIGFREMNTVGKAGTVITGALALATLFSAVDDFKKASKITKEDENIVVDASEIFEPEI